MRELNKHFWPGHVSRADFDAAQEAKKLKKSKEKKSYNTQDTGVGAHVFQSSAELRASLTTGSPTRLSPRMRAVGLVPHA